MYLCAKFLLVLFSSRMKLKILLSPALAPFACDLWSTESCRIKESVPNTVFQKKRFLTDFIK